MLHISHIHINIRLGPSSQSLVFLARQRLAVEQKKFNYQQPSNYLENQLLLISINFTPKTSLTVALKKWYFPMFSR